jgi:DNA topoisomerase-1
LRESRDGIKREYVIHRLSGDKIQSSVETEMSGQEKNKLFPTDIGMVVTDFLHEHFKEIMDYGFTASVEKEFDDIAEGSVSWSKMIDSFYLPFHKNVENTLEHADRAQGEREIGIDPSSGKKIIGRIGRYGPLVQIGDNEDEEKKFASLRPGQTIENLSLNEALDLFKLPRNLGELEGHKVTAAIGRFGPYIKIDKLFVSIPKDMDVFEITLDEAAELIRAKRELEANRLIKAFEEEDELQLLNGRWGPYISYKKNNYKLPKGSEPSRLTYDEVIEIIKQAPPPKPSRRAVAAEKPKAKAKAKRRTVKKTVKKK